jgi:uncharacterized membrane protein (UPF0127 family)
MQPRIRFPILIITLLLLSAMSNTPIPFTTQEIAISTKEKQHYFSVEVAQTVQQRRLGLMNRQHMEEGHGMLFLFEQEKIVHFWTLHTYISLDIVFINSNGSVAHMIKNTPLNSRQTISSRYPIVAAVELPAGTIDRLSIPLGASVQYKTAPTL